MVFCSKTCNMVNNTTKAHSGVRKLSSSGGPTVCGSGAVTVCEAFSKQRKWHLCPSNTWKASNSCVVDVRPLSWIQRVQRVGLLAASGRQTNNGHLGFSLTWNYKSWGFSLAIKNSPRSQIVVTYLVIVLFRNQEKEHMESSCVSITPRSAGRTGCMESHDTQTNTKENQQSLRP